MKRAGRGLSRRDAIKALGMIGGGLLVGTGAWANAADKSAIVAKAHRPGILAGGSPDPEAVRSAVDAAVAKAAGTASPADAWAQMFRPSDTVGIKINALGLPPLRTSPAVVDAIITGLAGAGVSQTRIIVWDMSELQMRRAGYRVSTRPDAVRFIGNDSPGVGYADETFMHRSIESRLSRVVSDMCTALVNVPVVKDHDLAGVSAGMKNWYGAVHNPQAYHASGCDPYIADLSALPAIRQKLRLVVADGLTAQCHGGPNYVAEYAWPAEMIMASADPVAIDAVARGIIEGERARRGLPTLEEAGRPAEYIHTAASLGLGTDDEAAITTVAV